MKVAVGRRRRRRGHCQTVTLTLAGPHKLHDSSNSHEQRLLDTKYKAQIRIYLDSYGYLSVSRYNRLQIWRQIFVQFQSRRHWQPSSHKWTRRRFITFTLGALSPSAILLR